MNISTLYTIVSYFYAYLMLAHNVFRLANSIFGAYIQNNGMCECVVVVRAMYGIMNPVVNAR